MNNLEPWERWFIKHRGSELSRLVTRLAEVLLRKGECTADDARAVPLDGDPRIRGGAVRPWWPWGWQARARLSRARRIFVTIGPLCGLSCWTPTPAGG